MYVTGKWRNVQRVYGSPQPPSAGSPRPGSTTSAAITSAVCGERHYAASNPSRRQFGDTVSDCVALQLIRIPVVVEVALFV